MPISKNALYRHDITIACPFFEFSEDLRVHLHERSLKDILDLMCKEFVFQMERGGRNDKPHYQIRISLKKKAKTMVVLDNLYGYLKSCTAVEDGVEHPLWAQLEKGHIHISPTQSTTKTFDYVMKSDTRERDPVSSKPIDLLVPQDLVPVSQFNEFQRFIANEWIYNAIEWDPLGRRILSVVDSTGGAGKSQVQRSLCAHYPNLFAQFNADSSIERLVASVIDAGPRKAYFIDLPRASGVTSNDVYAQDKHNERMVKIMNFCEQLKDGNVVSSFYGKYSQLIMTKPVVIIFSNWPVGQQFLTPDRVIELNPATFNQQEYWEKYKPNAEDSAYATLLKKVRGYKE